MQGSWRWLTVQQALTAGSLPAEVRSFLEQMEPEQTLDFLVERVDSLARSGPEGPVYWAALGLIVVAPWAVGGIPLGLLFSATALPPILREARQNLRIRRSLHDQPELAERVRRAGEEIGPPWRIPDSGGHWDRRYTVSDRLPRRQVLVSAGRPEIHEFELVVPRGRLAFRCQKRQAEVEGPGQQRCTFPYRNIHHGDNSISLDLGKLFEGFSLIVRLDGRLLLTAGEAPDPICPGNYPGTDDEITLPDGLRRWDRGTRQGSGAPKAIVDDLFEYEDLRIRSPLPLSWLT